MANIPEPAQGKSWRDVLPIHPAADLFPLMSPDELKVLGEDIKKNGLLTPIVVWSPIEGSEEQYLLDGRNRIAAMEAAGGRIALKGQAAAHVWRGYGPAYFLYGTAACGAPGFDPYEYVLSANIHRRHLTAKQKRELIAKVLKARPTSSDRQIAKITKASPTTVGTVRAEMEAEGDVSKLDTRTDTKGRKQTAKKRRRDVDDFLAEKRARKNEAVTHEEAHSCALEIQESAATLADVIEPATGLQQPKSENPIASAWRKATITQRKEFALAFAIELLRLQQCDGTAGEKIREAEEQRTAEAKLPVEDDPLEIPPYLRRTA
jgi:hypothetical protein